MSSIPFEYQPITTMTLVFYMKGKINYDLLYPLIPMVDVDRIEAETGKPLTMEHKFKPGTIINGRNIKHRRGFFEGKYDPESEAFKNSFSANVAATLKIVNVKVPADSIQITGAKSLDNAREAVSYIIESAYQADSMLKLFRRNREAIIEWMKQATYDPTTYVYQQGDEFIPYTRMNDRFDVSKSPDPYVCGYMMELVRDYDLHENFCKLLDHLNTIEDNIIISGPYDIDHVTISTINLNYSLGTNIRRCVLDSIMQHYPQYCSRYVNAIEQKVSIDQVCTELPRRGAKKIQPKHSIQVHGTGMVTQSGPRPDKMKKVYNEFNAIVREHYPLIRMDAANQKEQDEKTAKATIPVISEPSPDLMIEGEVIVEPTYIHLKYSEFSS